MVTGLRARMQIEKKNSNNGKVKRRRNEEIDVNRHHRRMRERGKQWNNKNANERHKKKGIEKIDGGEGEWAVESAKRRWDVKSPVRSQGSLPSNWKVQQGPGSITLHGLWMFWFTPQESRGRWDKGNNMRARKNKKERGAVGGGMKASQAVERRKRRGRIVFWGATTVLAIKHEGDYCVGEFA